MVIKKRTEMGILDRKKNVLVLYLSFDENEGNVTSDNSNFNNTGYLGNSFSGVVS